MLASGGVVLSDRYDASSLAYQSVTSGTDSSGALQWIRNINRHARRPDLTIVLDVSPALGAVRRETRGEAAQLYEQNEVQRALATTAPARGNPAGWRAAIVTRSPRLESVLDEAQLVAKSDVSVFVHGESGTGKELLAQAIHKASPRATRPFVPVNCGAIPSELLESELFGHVKGAFTGANTAHDGLFVAATGGTLFLDEIGDLPLAMQAKILRALQERQVRPVGSTRNVEVDVRIISATHRDLDQLVADGSFREDLYYRLNVVELRLPPLRERREDLPLLVEQFLARLAEKAGEASKRFAPEATRRASELTDGQPWLVNALAKEIVAALKG